MADSLREVGGTGGRPAICGLILTAAISAAVNLLVVILPIDPKARADIPGPLIVSGLVFGSLPLGCLGMLLRLPRQARCSNKVTMMPAWFIQGFGLLFAIGIGLAALQGGQGLFLAEGFLVARNLLLLPRLLRRRPAKA